MSETLAEHLKSRRGGVQSVGIGTTVADAVVVMNRERIGALIVLDGETPVGIFTERDLLERVVAEGKDAQATKVDDVMSPKLICVGPELTVEEACAVAAHKRCGHLPVVAEGKMIGLVSAGDLLRWRTPHRREEIKGLYEVLG